MSELYTRNASHKDEFNRKPTAVLIAEIAVTVRSANPLVVGVYGPWGSGKTEFLRLMKQSLEQKRDADDQQILSVWFDPWKYEHRQDIGAGLVARIIESVGIQTKGGNQDELFALQRTTLKLLSGIKGAIGQININVSTGVAGASANIGEVTTAFKDGFGGEDEKFQADVDKLLTDIKSALSNRLKKHRLVVFIDDLDRCLPEQILRVLEALHLYLYELGLIAIIGVDREAVEQAVRLRYGFERDDGAAYVDKIIDIPFYLNSPSDDLIQKRYGRDYESLNGIDGNIGDFLKATLSGNPRRYERFFNYYSVICSRPIVQSELLVDPARKNLVVFLSLVAIRSCFSG